MSTANILYLVGLIVVIVALVIWIATISARARRVSDASDARLAAQLADYVKNPDPAPKPFAEESAAERSSHVVAMAEDDDETPVQIATATKADRLAELADLHAKGTISDDELTDARAKILAE